MSTYQVETAREWWAQRWIDVLESFGWIRRLERARNYARQGNILSLEFQDHKVLAQVQGTAPEPYDVSLSLDPFSPEEWNYVIGSLAQKAIFSAKLLAGEMPPTIESVFTTNGLSLFPLTKFDIHSQCSCPDKATPCKHIGAVYYLLGDRFSEDPFVLFQLRGRSRQEIIQALRETRHISEPYGEPILPSPTPSPSSQTSDHNPEKTRPESKPMKTSPEPNLESQESSENASFWQYNAPLASSLVVITPPLSTETTLDLLGPIPFKTDETDSTLPTPVLMEQIKTIYQHVSLSAVQAAMVSDPSS